jgi:cation diffusion facilitator CzcD-associated flavoprotein CzcO
MSAPISVKGKSAMWSASSYDVVIMGAGPYGLASAAHLTKRGLKVGIFGRPLSFWREQMPEAMILRSYWWATNIADPQGRYSLEKYFAAIGREPFDPLPAEVFIKYGLWFQQQAVPDVDETFIERIEQSGRRFLLTLEDGRRVESKAVVMAPGLHYYVHRPDEYNHLPQELISHTADRHTFEQFAGKRLAVIGGGQSALENAALAYESGAQVDLIARHPIVWIAGSGSFPKHRSLKARLYNPKAGISSDWYSWWLEHFPYQFQHLSREEKDNHLSGRGRYGSMGAAWLKPRVVGVINVHESQSVQEVKETDSGLELLLSNGKRLEVDHLILGTGYRVDLSKLPMLAPPLVAQIQTYRGAPVLSDRFESSVPGLYFVGASSVSSCGPLYRFVLGTKAAARRIAQVMPRSIAYAR